ncbi:MAG: succinylglutamate desuccinylase/aspartoacylase family protein [Alphaproteobacteria bacterium]|nr:succinylglutamate desuccinylase/aspartoacylase family protein [Alphaproteobacteria bacterium]
MLALLLLAAALAEAPPIGEAWVYAPAGPARRALAQTPVNFAESIEGDWVLVQGYAEDLDALSEQGFSLRDRRADHRLPARAYFGEDGYHDSEAVVAELEALSEAWPERAELIDLGRSVEGRPLLALRVGTAGAPAIRVIGGHHGDERPSVELALAIAEALLTEAPGFEGLVDSREVWILPLLNPDGLEAGTRYNADGVDLNRNYDFQWSAGSVGAGPAAFSEPETRAARRLALLAAPMASLSLHTGAENIGYVYNYTEQDSVEEARLAALAEAYVADCGRLGFEAVQGAEWYITHGDATDWAFGRAGTLDFTVELWREKTPDAAWLPELIEDHLPAVAAFLRTPPDLEISVVDAESGRPLAVQFDVVGDTARAWGEGALYRFAAEGPQRISLRAPGFEEQDLELELPGSAALSLSPATRSLAGVRVSPTLLTRDLAEPRITLLGVDALPATLTLSRPGFEELTLSLDGEAYPVAPEALAAGPWTLSAELGVLRHGLLMASEDALVRLSSLEWEGGALTVRGAGFGRGSRAWLLDAGSRVPEAVTVLEERERALVLDLSDLPEAGTFDLLLWSNGRELAVADLLGEPQLDPGHAGAPSSPRVSPAQADTPAREPSYASCSTPTSAARLPWPALLLLLLRRRRCAPH